MRSTLAGLEELERFPTEEARREALDSWARQGEGFTNPRWWLGLVLVGGAAFGAMRLISWFIDLIAPGLLPELLEEAVLLLFGFVAFFIALRWLHRWGAARALRTELLRAGVPVCRRCGYLLRGLQEDASRCPECGRPFDGQLLEVLNRTMDGEAAGNDAAGNVSS